MPLGISPLALKKQKAGRARSMPCPEPSLDPLEGLVLSLPPVFKSYLEVSSSGQTWCSPKGCPGRHPSREEQAPPLELVWALKMLGHYFSPPALPQFPISYTCSVLTSGTTQCSCQDQQRMPAAFPAALGRGWHWAGGRWVQAWQRLSGSHQHCIPHKQLIVDDAQPWRQRI